MTGVGTDLDRATAAVAIACQAVGVDTARVVIASRGNRCRVVKETDGTHTIHLPRRRLTALDDAELLGVMAHEAAHIRHGDNEPPSTADLRRTALRLWAGGTLVALVSFAGIAWSLTVASAAAGAAIAALSGGPVFVLGLVFLLRWVNRAFWLRRGIDPRDVEFRADATAAAGVGREPVEAWLRTLKPGKWRAVETWLAGTHPTRARRLEAISVPAPTHGEPR